MLKVISQTFLGILFALGGIYVLYLYIISINTGANLLFLILSLLLIGGGVFLFIKASKSESAVDSKIPLIKPSDKSDIKAESLLAKNNAMFSEWNKTNDTKENLKIFQLSPS